MVKQTRTRLIRLSVLTAITLMVGFLASCGPAINIDGTWSGVLATTYLCEGAPDSVEIEILEGTITITGGGFNGYSTFTDLTGVIEPQNPDAEDGRFLITFNHTDGAIRGLLVVDAEAGHAAFIVESAVYDPQGSWNDGYIGVLSLGALQPDFTVLESDLVGDWSGVAVRINNDFGVTASGLSTATIADGEALDLTGSDNDGTFSGFVSESSIDVAEGFFESNQITWPGDDTYDAMFALSYDKDYLAVAFLRSICSSSIFDDLADQKFALWKRDAE